MNEPTYTFTVPSIHDDTSLDCRIYHPKALSRILHPDEARLRGAIVAHPYAPLGGCYDDETVLSVTECLLKQGYVVFTFNFRGAGDSAGKTSWTGKPEVDDYSTIVGLAIYYLQNLTIDPSPIELLLAGYSFGSLILARLPCISSIMQNFESAETGTAAREIFLRAQTLATQTRQVESQAKSSKAVTIGGEETPSSSRRRSRDSRRSAEGRISEIPHQIKSHIKRQKNTHREEDDDEDDDANIKIKIKISDSSSSSLIKIKLHYLLISPVLVPLTTLLLSPGIPFTSGTSTAAAETTYLMRRHRTLIAFGSADTFTSSKKLKTWCERLAEKSSGRLEWTEIADAGHFWREKGVMRTLQKSIISWLDAP
ncbi:hypothetical protein AC578_4608 [Pseudocercospora eumusae]|uniref:AB hydrolase-1 domain-containing protein n=1 Tax=Pseudocercospora eumusae TaxID=321146 RepID=A0A139H4W8_9PEZI|nr:hypothetical protein AC578_4608 [Pseudocercospora eumusae]